MPPYIKLVDVGQNCEKIEPPLILMIPNQFLPDNEFYSKITECSSILQYMYYSVKQIIHT